MSEHRKSTLVLAVFTVFIATGLFLPGLVGAGDLEPPATPDDPASAMYTLEDVYDRLNSNTQATKRDGPFTEPSAGPGSTGRTLDEVYQKVNLTQVEETGQTDCYYDDGTLGTCTCGDVNCPSGQDGDLEKGVAWPVPRFTDNGDGTVTDRLTGLIWLKNANCPNGNETWSGALTFANSLYDGWTGDGGGGDCNLGDGSSAGDWRLPNLRELHSLIHYGFASPAVPNTAGTSQGTEYDPFTGLQSLYWSSTTYAGNTGVAWFVTMGNGYVNTNGKANQYYVWPVRGGN